MQEKQYKILDEAIKLVPFDGWSTITLQEAANNAGFPVGYERIAFKAGVKDAISLLHKKIDIETECLIDKDKLKSMRVRDKIYYIVNNRLEIMDKYKPTIRKGVQFFILPTNIASSIKMLWEIADNMWCQAEDKSTDFNYYTKRATLAGVYSSTLLFWLEDDSEKHQETSAFLKRRIENIMQFEKLKGKLKNFSFH